MCSLSNSDLNNNIVCEEKQQQKSLILPKAIVSHLDRYVKGQEKAKRAIATAFYLKNKLSL